MLNIEKCLEENIRNIQNSFHHTSDLKVRNLKVGYKGSAEMAVVYLDGIIDLDLIQEHVVKPLLETFKTVCMKELLIDKIMGRIIESADVKTTTKYKELTDAIVQGSAVLLINEYQQGIIIPSPKWAERSIEATVGERSARGPQIGLTEKMKTNINLIRSSIKTLDFCVDTIELGSISPTSVSILYIEGIVDKGILKKVKKRINSLRIKYVLSERVVEDVLEGKPRSIFPRIRHSERIDGVVSSLFEGRVAVIVDGYPFAIIAPALFVEFLQAPDEYHIPLGRFTSRTMRLFAFLMGVYLPAVYIALANFHKDDLPKKISEAIISKDELLPTFWEIIILIFLIRILVDVSFRLPQTAVILVSLIGTIVIGETAVTAKLIHPVSLIVIGITTLSSFLGANRGLVVVDNTLRIIFLLTANFFGFTGLIIAITLQIIYMVSLKSVGVPYLSPLIPFKMQELKDTLYREDLQKLTNSKHTYTKDNN
ncbi:spore gernimation protein GerA [Sutcliffiella horikoshii]|uniref:Spore gernimation protein GerA n=1 Tax=Sutcliffiella horikoshii TaxID=79883 RepID=A0ABM6KKA3_9BACI|nr:MULTISPECIES: spore germination protein [Bacillaceae]ART76908.1 spore gernimation protein GerA [Sutcliffiella horikoshii]